MTGLRRLVCVLALGLLAPPLAARAQPAAKVARVGLLATGERPSLGESPTLEAFKTAQALGLGIPPDLLLRADRVIK